MPHPLLWGMRSAQLFPMARIPKLAHPPRVLDQCLKSDDYALCVLRYTTPTILRSVNVCNPTVPTTARLLGASFLVDVRLTVGPLTRP